MPVLNIAARVIIAEVESDDADHPHAMCFPWKTPLFREHMRRISDEKYPHDGLTGLADAPDDHPLLKRFTKPELVAFKSAMKNFKKVASVERETFFNKNVMFKAGLKVLDRIWVGLWTAARMNAIVDEILEQDSLMVWQAYHKKNWEWPPAIINVRNTCQANGGKLANSLFGAVAILEGDATETAMEILKSIVRWAWARQRRAGLLRLEKKDKHRLEYEKAKDALEHLTEATPSARKLKVAKQAFDAAINYSKDLYTFL
ncbi:hypothetical protein SCHPADRAFT_896475, partial [Schizopora paradoxa]